MTEQETTLETSSTLFDPIMVVAISQATVAVWQVETDPTVARGDFSGAWLITPEGIQGFASSAEWIEQRDSQSAMLATILRYPVILADGTELAELEELLPRPVPDELGQSSPARVTLVNKDQLGEAARAEIEAAKEEFARVQPGKKQPAWGTVGDLHPVDGPVPAGHDPDAAAAVRAALATARGLREWLDQWQDFDKVRVRRLGAVDSSHSEARPAPLP